MRRLSRVAAGLALAFAVAWTLPAAAPASTATPRLTPPIHVTKGDIAPSRTFTSPFVAVDPEDPDTVVAAFVEMRSARCGLLRSRDGGRTWKLLDSSPSPPSHPSCLQMESGGATHSPIAFGRDHTLYYALAGYDPGRDGRNNSVLLARSSDMGDNWTTTIIADPQGKTGTEVQGNRPIASLAVDRHNGPQDIVYVSWLRYYPNATPRPPNQSLVAVSTDAGRTFAEPVSLLGNYFESEAARRAALVVPGQPAPPTTAAPATRPESVTAAQFGGGTPQLVVDGRGTVSAVLSAGPQMFVPAPWRGYYLSRSDDHGRTFTMTPAVPAHGSLGNPILRWSPSGGPEGTLHLVYESRIPMVQGDRDVAYRRSTDGGRTWSEAQILNDDNPELVAGQFIPNLSVAPDGRLDAVWWDFRNDPGTTGNDVYLSSSTDNGVTWSQNTRVNDRLIDRKIGPWGNGFDMRQPPGIAATRQYTIVLWDDTRNGTPEVQTQDIYGSLVQWHPLPPSGSPALVYVFAAVVGVLLAGFVITVGAVWIRRRSRDVVSRTDGARKAPANVG